MLAVIGQGVTMPVAQVVASNTVEAIPTVPAAAPIQVAAAPAPLPAPSAPYVAPYYPRKQDRN